MSAPVNGLAVSIADEIASHVGPAGIDSSTSVSGTARRRCSCSSWASVAQSVGADACCHALVDRDLQLVRFDNRGVDLSDLTDAPTPDWRAVLGDDLSSVSRTLSNMP